MLVNIFELKKKTFFFMAYPKGELKTFLIYSMLVKNLWHFVSAVNKIPADYNNFLTFFRKKKNKKLKLCLT